MCKLNSLSLELFWARLVRTLWNKHGTTAHLTVFFWLTIGNSWATSKPPCDIDHLPPTFNHVLHDSRRCGSQRLLSRLSWIRNCQRRWVDKFTTELYITCSSHHYIPIILEAALYQSSQWFLKHLQKRVQCVWTWGVTTNQRCWPSTVKLQDIPAPRPGWIGSEQIATYIVLLQFAYLQFQVLVKSKIHPGTIHPVLLTTFFLFNHSRGSQVSFVSRTLLHRRWTYSMSSKATSPSAIDPINKTILRRQLSGILYPVILTICHYNVSTTIIEGRFLLWKWR